MSKTKNYKGIQNTNKRNLYVDRFKNSPQIQRYLQNEECNFGIYVSHRINEIFENTELNEWNYVSSESNIADKTSRSQTFKQLFLEKSWFNDPTFLLNNDFNKEFSVNSINITKSRVKKFPLNWDYYSSFTKTNQASCLDNQTVKKLVKLENRRF